MGISRTEASNAEASVVLSEHSTFVQRRGLVVLSEHSTFVQRVGADVGMDLIRRSLPARGYVVVPTEGERAVLRDRPPPSTSIWTR